MTPEEKQMKIRIQAEQRKLMQAEKREQANILRMMYPKVECMSSTSSLFACRDYAGNTHLYTNGVEIFNGTPITDIKSFKTLLAIQIPNEVIIINKDNFDIIKRHTGFSMVTKKVNRDGRYALLEMHDIKDNSSRVEVYNIGRRTVAMMLDWADWETDGYNIIIKDKDGREFQF